MAGIRLNSNILSLNAQRRLGEASSSLNDSFSKLSSGLRITKPADDAAGLAISESLKTDARLSSQALRNVNDGISMISIINGALDAQKGILYRMAELAEQSANGVLSAKQREPLQNEYMALQEEFDRIASSATFNDISLLRNPDANTISLMAGITGADSSLLEVAAANSHRFAGEYALRADPNDDGTIDHLPFATSDTGHQLIFARGELTEEQIENSLLPGMGVMNVSVEIDSTDIVIEGIASFSISRAFADDGTSGDPIVVGDTPPTLLVVGAILLNDGSIAQFGDGVNSDNPGEVEISVPSVTGTVKLDFSGMTFTTHENPNDTVRSSNIGLTSIGYKSQAQISLDTVSNKIEDLSILQGQFGALESRLEVAASKLSIDRENFLAAAAQITDVDVAKEATNLTTKQILTQSSTAILAQANQQPEIALKLLKDV